VCDELYSDTAWHPYYRQAANNCAETIRAKIHQWRDIKVVGKDAIRALAPEGQNAAPPNGPSEMGRMIDEKRTVAAPVAWMFTNEEGDDDFGNNWTALANKSYREGPAIPLYRAAPSLTKEEAGAISEMLAWGIRKPNTQFAYSRCKVCDQPFWEREEHRGDCNLVKWRNALRAKLREHAEREGKDG
jgi:hypothetical protein